MDSTIMKKLEHEFNQKLAETLNTDDKKAKLPKQFNSLKYLINEFDSNKEDHRTKKVLSMISAYN